MMNRALSCITKGLLLVACAITLIALTSEQASAQTRFAWTDSIAVTTSDTVLTFSPRWESVNIWFSGCDGFVKYSIGPGDTAGWSSCLYGKQYIELSEGMTLTIIKSKDLGIAGLYKIAAKAKSGTGALFLTGTKTAYSE